MLERLIVLLGFFLGVFFELFVLFLEVVVDVVVVFFNFEGLL